VSEFNIVFTGEEIEISTHKIKKNKQNEIFSVIGGINEF
jgi:hypothetical protein